MEKFIDVAECNGIGVFIKGIDLIASGNTIYSMPIEDKNEEYQRIAENYDIHFIFDDNIPQIDFYTIPYIDIMAMDSFGGYIGTVGEMSDLESTAPICYISKEKQFYIVADNFKVFMQHLASWKKEMKLNETVVFYQTKAEAKATNDFFDLGSFEISKASHEKGNPSK